MTERPDFDHTSFAVRDATAWARRLRSVLGATPIAGETLPDFRYLLLHVGTATRGSRLEFIEPMAAGFASAFLDKRGEGPHHLTFTVPDLRESIARVLDLGLRVTGVDHSDPSWQEAFIAPDRVHGVVIQLAQSDTEYPAPPELLATTDRDVESFPSTAGATGKTWWTPVWDTAPGPAAVLGATQLGSADLDLSQRLFGELLGGEATELADGVSLEWPGGALRVHAGEPGVQAVEVAGAPDDLTIGNTPLHDPRPARTE